MPTQIVGVHEEMSPIEVLRLLKQGLYVSYETANHAVVFTPNSDELDVLVETNGLSGGRFVVRKRLAA